jgi:hypothetical protein
VRIFHGEKTYLAHVVLRGTKRLASGGFVFFVNIVYPFGRKSKVPSCPSIPSYASGSFFLGRIFAYAASVVISKTFCFTSHSHNIEVHLIVSHRIA